MIVRLCAVKCVARDKAVLRDSGIVIRRALAPEKTVVLEWVRRNFPPNWIDECDIAFSGQPLRCHLTTSNGQPIGFSVYDVIALGVAGPLGIDPNFRRHGIGKVLFSETLLAMRSAGYAYAILGWIPKEAQAFYQSVLFGVQF
jgi:ribosomal protein S18 acetylase RimI-like enzyme